MSRRIAQACNAQKKPKRVSYYVMRKKYYGQLFSVNEKAKSKLAQKDLGLACFFLSNNVGHISPYSNVYVKGKKKLSQTK